jgi:prefoldin subunit 5
MKNLELRSSLIKSAILLGLCIFFVYAFAANGSGGVFGTIGSLFSGVLFIAGLALAVIVSILVMFGIYFGIIYMYDKDVCRKTYDEFKDKVGGLSNNYAGTLGLKCCSSTGSQTEIPPVSSDEDLTLLRSNHDELSGQLTSISDSVDSVEKTCSSLSTSVETLTEELNNLSTRATTIEEELESKAPVSSVEDSTSKLAADISNLEKSFQPLNDKMAELEKALSSFDTTEESTDDSLQKKIDQAVSGLQGELKTLKESIENLNQPVKKAQESSGEEESHRILSYFANKKDKDQFTSLVEEAVAKEMTYAQAGELLNGSLSAGAAKIIGEHPSLTKDYIKVSRLKK